MSTSGHLSAALEKLSAALDDAEAAADARRIADASEDSDAADTGALKSALADLRSDYANLKAAADDVTHRLDGTIERVESILSERA